MTVLYMPEGARAELDEWVRAGYPHETCGLLVGTQGPGRAQVARVVRARNLNVERARDRYELDPEDFISADAAARGAGMELIGVWHSHPDHPAIPSETDRAAAWPGWSYVILSVTEAGVADVRSWRLDGDDFEPEAVHPCPQ